MFGMGTGVTLLVWSPENRLQAVFPLASACFKLATASGGSGNGCVGPSTVAHFAACTRLRAASRHHHPVCTGSTGIAPVRNVVNVHRREAVCPGASRVFARWCGKHHRDAVAINSDKIITAISSGNEWRLLRLISNLRFQI